MMIIYNINSTCVCEEKTTANIMYLLAIDIDYHYQVSRWDRVFTTGCDAVYDICYMLYIYHIYSSQRLYYDVNKSYHVSA